MKTKDSSTTTNGKGGDCQGDRNNRKLNQNESGGNNNVPYLRINKVTGITSEGHCNDFKTAMNANPDTFFVSGWGATLLCITDPTLCVYHGLCHTSPDCNVIKNFLPLPTPADL